MALVGTDQLNVDPLLDVLADNGGPTMTHALLVGSTAINNGTNTGAPTTDQRGFLRSDGLTDIGAYEYGVGLLVVDTASDILDGDTSSISALLATKGTDGFISLREAITAANNSANGTSPDEIHFNIAGVGPHTIQVGNVGDGNNGLLPVITNNAVIIDGWSEPGFLNTPLIRIDGAVAPNGAGLSFSSTSDGSTVRGLMITDFQGGTGDGILVQAGADNITILGNWIGTTGTGSTGVGNADDGIDIRGSGAIIGGTGVNDGNVITNSWRRRD